MKILIVHGKGEGPLASDGHDTLLTSSEVEALNSLSADHSVAKSLERGERLVCREELSVQQTPDTISIKVEEDIGGGLPAVEYCGASSESLGVDAPGSSHMASHTISIKVEEDICGDMSALEDGNDIRDCSTQRGATSESLSVDAPHSSNMSSHNRELNLSVYRQGEGPLAVDGHDTLHAASQLEALSSLSADHSVAKSLNCSVQLVPLEELTGHRGGRKGRPGVLGGKVIPNKANQIHTDEKPYRCHQCMKRFSRKGYLNRHVMTHSGEKPYKCDQCMMRFQRQCDLKIHVRTHSGEKPYKCHQCTKRFSQKGSLKLHMRTHSGEKPYRCYQCTMSFSLNGTLKTHMRTHSLEKPYRCDQCTMSFSLKDTLKIHMRTHSREKPYKCDQCVKRYIHYSALKTHMRTHTGEKPYKCDQCTKRFGLKGSLKTHMRTHSGEKPYKCKRCKKRFGESSKLKLHMRTPSGAKPYMCAQCTETFRPSSKLKIHMRTYTGEKPYGCDQYMKSSVVEQEHFQWDGQEDCDAFGDRSTQRGATSESLGVDAPGSSHASSHSEELKMLIVQEEGMGPLAIDGRDTLFTATEVEALNSLSADHSAAKSLERGERLVCHEELSVQQTLNTISIKVEEDIGGSMPAVEDCDAFGDRSPQRGATSAILGMDAPGSSHMCSHSEELKILSVHGKVEGPLAGDAHDTLFTASEVEALNSLSADHSAAESLERGERLVCREQLSVQQTPDTISIKVEVDIGGGMPAVG
ncbi:unnamed protein product [Arctogadus glacialis]